MIVAGSFEKALVSTAVALKRELVAGLRWTPKVEGAKALAEGAARRARTETKENFIIVFDFMKDNVSAGKVPHLGNGSL